MKITALEVDGYGVWSGLKLDGLSDELNVFFGPNEAGKTTLMQFVRSVLYGFSPQRRQYLPPLRGGRPGGSVLIAGPNGRFQVSRHLDEDDADAPEKVTLSAADGTRQGEHLLKVLLCNIDEVIFNNVFAVGLRELQELGTLSDTEAASLLYNLSAGLDRVALVEVMRELEASRNRLLDCDARPCRVTQLLARREQLRTEIEELGELTRRYARKVAQRDQLQRETTRLEEEGNRLQHQQRVVEIAGAVADRWQQRAELDDQLLALDPVETMPEGAVDRLDAINARLEKHHQRVEGLKHRREQLRTEAAGLNINEALCRLAPRIEALQEQEDWIGTLQTRVADLETEIAELESQAAAEQERFGLEKETAENLPSVPERALAALRQPAKTLRQCRRRVEETQQEVARQRQSAQSLTGQIEAALAAHGEQDLAEAMDSAGSLVARLRRRTQISERLEEMDRYQAELEQQSRALLENQVLPVWVLLGLGAVFVVGVVLMMAGLLMPQSIVGSLGWPVALLGLAGTGAAVAAKFMLERSNARRLEACQKQIEMLQGQIRQAKDDRESLDRELPQASGSMGDHLRAAERQLAALEEIVPLDAQRQAARQDAEAAEGRAREAQERLSAAHRRWREALGALGLPPALSPKQVRELVGRRQQIGEIRRRLETRYEELQQRHRELDAIIARIAQLAADTDLAVAGEQPVEQLRQLVEQLVEQEDRLKRRTLLRAQARQIRRKRAKHETAIGRLKHRRRELLREVGAEDEPQFRQRALDWARAQTLRGKRETLQREIDAAIAGHCPEEALREQLEAGGGETLEARHDELKKRLQAAETKLHERYEKRGQFSEQLKALAEDRAPAVKQLELAMVEKQLDEAIGRWQVLAFTSQMLHSIRKTYEQDRQPETLQEASGYLERLTCGRYLRVWTPLGEDVLLVDDARGSSLPVEVLSQGAREQLFVCLRLALAASYARHGAPLPLVLDDVLVNFDAERAKAAAAVFRDFAAAGHQLLVFTCHEHIQKLFKSLRVPVQRLPSHAETDLVGPVSQKRSTKKQHPREPQPEKLPRKIAAEATGPQRVETVAPAEDDRAGEEQVARVDDHASWEYDEAEEQEELLVEEESQEACDEEEEVEEEDSCEYDEEEDYDDECDEQDEEEDEQEEEDEGDDDEDDYEDDFNEAEAA